jgi:hypothetical protein
VHVTRALDMGNYKEELGDDFIEQETRRRVFWASFMNDSFVTTRRGPARALVDTALRVHLPCPEKDFISGKTLQEKHEFLHSEGSESVYAGVMQAAHMW